MTNASDAAEPATGPKNAPTRPREAAGDTADPDQCGEAVAALEAAAAAEEEAAEEAEGLVIRIIAEADSGAETETTRTPMRRPRRRI